MTSPSISSTSRSTPCAAGCCGPEVQREVVDLRLRLAGPPAPRPLGGQGRVVAVVRADYARHEHARLDADWLVDDAASFPGRSGPRRGRSMENLAKRVPDESVVGQDAPQVGMTTEQNAVQVECSRSNQFALARPRPPSRSPAARRARSSCAAQAPHWSDRQQVIDDRETPRLRTGGVCAAAASLDSAATPAAEAVEVARWVFASNAVVRSRHRRCRPGTSNASASCSPQACGRPRGYRLTSTSKQARR